MAFKELEWREGLTDAVKIHNEAETDADCSASGAWRGASERELGLHLVPN
jgi:hypothetical protein